MKIIVLVILSLLVSCGPPIQYKDSILNYKGGGIKNNMDHYTFKIRMYNKKINQYEIKTIRVCDDYRVGETIK